MSTMEPLLFSAEDLFVGFTLQAKIVSSKHLKTSSRTLLALHLMTKYTLEAQAVNHLSL